MDVIAIDDRDDESRATVTIIAATRSPAHRTTELQRLGIGLDFMFSQGRAVYQQMPNRRLADRISDFRALRNRYGAPNVIVQVFFASLGDTQSLADAFVLERNRLLSDYSGPGARFSLQILGARELADMLNEAETRGDRVDDRIRIDYDRNRGTIIRRTLPGLDGLICSVNASEIARLVQTHPRIFDRNLRRYLGGQNAVNEAILATCADAEQAQLLWFLNNGLTILCDDFAVTPDQDDPFVQVRNMHIVNGCQTSSAIDEAQRSGDLHSDAWVLVRLFKATSPELAERVVVTTNTQTRITGRDLRSNDRLQVQLQRVFRDRFALFYERKPNEFTHLSRNDRRKVVSNERVGQAYLSIVLKKPSDGGRRKYKLWDDETARVFNSDVVPEAYLLSYRIWEACGVWKQRVRDSYPEDEVRRRILRNGLYHIARVVAFRWRGTDDWSDQQRLADEIRTLANDPRVVTDRCSAALELIAGLVSAEEEFVADVGGALKSGLLDRNISARLRGSEPAATSQT